MLCKFSPSKTDTEELRQNGFRCGLTLIYVPRVYVCDEYDDCVDGSDEKDCKGQKFVLSPFYQRYLPYLHSKWFSPGSNYFFRTCV